MTKDVTILRNFSHVKYGAFVRGEHRRMEVDLADIFINANLAIGCEHAHEGDEAVPLGVLEVADNSLELECAVIDTPSKRKKKVKK